MLTLQTGDIFADHYRLTRLIDTGGFADVWEAVFLSAGNTVALKIYPRLDADGVQNIENEYSNQAELSHSHLLIARYFGKHNGYPFLEMRYCPGGNASGKIGACDEAEVAKCMYHIASAIEYLHENNIVHQDVKPNNFLLDKNGNYLLADLGLSLKVRKTIQKFTQAKTGRDSSFTGLTPPAYRSPELYDRSNIGDQPVKATDIWAFGASLFEMMTGDMPFGEFGGLNQHKTPDVPDLPKKFSAELNGIVKKCLSKDTWERPKAHELAVWAHNCLQRGNYGFGQSQNPAPPQPSAGGPRKKTGFLAVWILLGAMLLAGLAWGINALVHKDIQPLVLVKTSPDSPRTFKSLFPIVPEKLRFNGIYRAKNAKTGYYYYLHFLPDNKVFFKDVPDILSPQKANEWFNANPAFYSIYSMKDNRINLPIGNYSYFGYVSDSLVELQVVSKEAVPEVPPMKFAFVAIDSSRRTIIGEDEPLIPPPVITMYPKVERPPESKEISIEKIERTPQKGLIVHFILQKPGDDNGTSTFTIYGPENKSNCFFVVAAGTKYRLTGISRSGQNLTFGTSGTIYFTGTFSKIPEYVKTIDIIEGEDRDRTNQIYWTFRGVHVN